MNYILIIFCDRNCCVVFTVRIVSVRVRDVGTRSQFLNRMLKIHGTSPIWQFSVKFANTIGDRRCLSHVEIILARSVLGTWVCCLFANMPLKTENPFQD
jgi:hypothetical protein